SWIPRPKNPAVGARGGGHDHPELHPIGPAMTLIRRILALAVAVPAVALAVPATAADDEDRVTWGVAPAAEDEADGRVSFRYELDPGAVVEDFLEVTNYSDRAVTFQLLSSDGVVGPDGAFDLLPAD